MDLLAGYSSDTDDNTGGREPCSKRVRDGESSPHCETSVVQTEPRAYKHPRLDSAEAVPNLAGTVHSHVITEYAPDPMRASVTMLAYMPLMAQGLCPHQ